MRGVLVVQALYYLITGLWPLISLRTFEAVTGPKTDDWLVHQVGLLAAAIGTALLVGSRRRPPNRETVTLAVLSISSFAAIEVVYVLNGTISRIYLADTAVQGAFLVALLVGYILGRAGRSAPGP